MVSKSEIHSNLAVAPFVYFGQRHINFDDLKKTFPQYSFQCVHQVHGVNIVEPSDSTVKADGIVTNKMDQATAIQTADCLPVLAYHSGMKKIWALHAGWRGLVQGIINEAFRDLVEPNLLQVWIGPHIHKNSFTVREDTVHQFPKEFVTAKDSEFYYVDLTAFALKQLNDLKIKSVVIHQDNTFEDQKYHSFRRDKTSGRQWSFIAIPSHPQAE